MRQLDTRLELTESTRALFTKVERDMQAMEDTLLEGMSEEEVVALVKSLEQMLFNLVVEKDIDTRCCGSEEE